MQKLFTVPLLLWLSLAANAQDKPVPAEAGSFIPAGYESLDYITGDLNGDKKPDAILILKQHGEDSLGMEETQRPFILLIRQSDGKLKQVLRNDNVVMCRHCGGVFGDPYEGIQIDETGFSLLFYGGSSWRWGYDYRFAYKPTRKNWYLVKESQTSFQSGDPEHTTKDVVIEETELGEIPLAAFNSDPVYEESRWKVKAVKTFFYTSPKPGSQPRKGYLLKGNIVSGIRQLKNFIEVSFNDGKGNFTDGYILKKDLEKIN